jgi:hypothetical protein
VAGSQQGTLMGTFEYILLVIFILIAVLSLSKGGI